MTESKESDAEDNSDWEHFNEHTKYTKIEVNLENSRDGIDFVGFGQMRVQNKSPEKLQLSMKKTGPKVIQVTAEKEKRLVTTNIFTPHSVKSGYGDHQLGESVKSLKNSLRSGTQSDNLRKLRDLEKQVDTALYRPANLFNTTGNTTCSRRT